MERTLETITINNALEVVRLKGELKFKHPLGYTRPSSYSAFEIIPILLCHWYFFIGYLLRVHCTLYTISKGLGTL